MRSACFLKFSYQPRINTDKLRFQNPCSFVFIRGGMATNQPRAALDRANARPDDIGVLAGALTGR
jgi:hypothetical protein